MTLKKPWICGRQKTKTKLS